MVKNLYAISREIDDRIGKLMNYINIQERNLERNIENNNSEDIMP